MGRNFESSYAVRTYASSSPPSLKRIFLWIVVSFLTLSFFWISSAYAQILYAPPPPPPPKPTFISGDAISIMGVNTRGFLPDGIIAARADNLMGSMLKAANANPQRLLWAMYPASVRGRVFNDNVAVSDPFSSMGGGGW